MIYTSYWGNIKNLLKEFGKDKIISVSRYNRFWNGKRCSMLYPSVQLLRDYKNGVVNEEQYTEIFNRQLEKLNPSDCYKVFNGCVFVCYEKTGFCHRHLICEWLKKNGFPCTEY